MDRRKFGKKLIALIASSTVLGGLFRKSSAQTSGYDPSSHYFGMGVQINKCIGCGKCVEACKEENNVPKEPFFFRTWVERYRIKKDNQVVVQNIDKRISGESESDQERDILRSFFVPKTV